MQYKNKIWLYVFSIILLLWAGLFTVNKTFAETTIPVSIDTSLQVVQRLLVTIDWWVLGTPLADFNTGGNIIFYVPIKDGAGNRYITSESDPTFSSSSAAGIHALNISQWNSAYTRWNHALMWYLTGEVDPLWSLEKSSYYTKTEVDNLLSSSVGGLKYKGVWDYSTGALPSDVSLGSFFKISVEGNFSGLHLFVGDMIIANSTVSGDSSPENWDIINNTVSETDPVFAASIAAAISATQVSQWNDAYSRGNHALMWYLTGESDPLWSLEKIYYYTKAQIDAKNYLTSFTELDPAWNADKGNYYTKNDIDNKFEALSGSIGGITWEIDPEWNSAKANYYTKFAIDNKGFLTGFSETDPIFAASIAGQIWSSDITKWDSAYNWIQNNSWNKTYYTKSEIDTKLFLTGFTETDPIWNSEKTNYYSKSAIDSKGFLTGFDEADPIWNSEKTNYYSKSAIDSKGFLTSFTELDPLFSASVAAQIGLSDISDWNSASNWISANSGNALYFFNNSGNYYTKSAIDNKWFLTGQVWKQYGADLSYMSGNVGIWTTTPAQKLEVNGILRIAGNATHYVDLRQDNGNGMPLALSFSKPSGEYGSYLDIQQSHQYYGFLLHGTAWIGGWVSAWGGQGLDAYGNFGISIANKSKDIVFYGANFGSEIMRLQGTGNVGIWTSTPSTKLEVIGNIKIPSNWSLIIGSSIIDSSKISNWDAAYSRGNHAIMWYLTGFTESDPIWNSASGNYYSKSAIDSKWFLTSFTELDPLFSASVAAQIGFSDISDWSSASNWITANSGNALYFFNNSGNYYTKSAIDNKWFLTGFMESDPVWNAASSNYYSKSAIDNKWFLTGQFWDKTWSTLNYMSGNIGIGVNNPLYPIDISWASIRVTNPITGGNATITLENNNVNATASYVGQYTLGNEQAGGSPYQLNRIVIGPKNNTMIPILAVRQFDQNTSKGAFFEFYNRGGPGTAIYEGLRIMVGNPFSQAWSMDATIDTQAAWGWTLRNIQLKPGGITSLFLWTNGYNGIWTVSSTSKWWVLGNLAVGTTYGNLAAPVWGAIIEGNLGVGTSTPTALLHIKQPTAWVGTVTVATGATTVAWVGTQFTNTFKVGDTITIWGQTRTISIITSDTALTVSAAITSGFTATGFTLIGGDRFVVQWNGNVWIGTNTPTYPLTVNWSSYIGGWIYTADGNWLLSIWGTNYLRTYSAGSMTFGTNNAEQMRIDTNGNIGIGTTTPNAKLTISDRNPIGSIFSTFLAGMKFWSTVSNAWNDAYLVTASDTAWLRWVYGAVKSRGTLAAPTSVQADDTLWTFLFGWYDWSQINFGWGLFAFVDGTPTLWNTPTRLSFVSWNNWTDRKERLTIKSNWDIGMGTTSPLAHVHISDWNSLNSYFSWLYSTANGSALFTTSNMSSSIGWLVASDTQNSRSLMLFQRSRWTLAAPTALQTNDYMWDILFGWYDGARINNSAWLFAFVDGTPTANSSTPTRLSFVAWWNASDRQERLTIKSDGNVGIWTTGPIEILHVLKDSSAGSYFRMDAINGAPGLQTYRANGSVASPTAPVVNNLIGLWSMRGYNGGYITSARAFFGGYAAENWSTNANGTYLAWWVTPIWSVTATETMRLDSNGNLGIWTTSPTSKLQVAGSLSLGYVEKTSAYTLTASDYTVNCIANTFTVTLPTAIGIAGRIYNIKNTGAGTITVAGNWSETIDWNNTVAIAQWQGIQIQSTNAGWIILSK